MELPVNCSKTDRKEPRCLSKGSFSPHSTTFYIYFFLTSIDTKFFITSRELNSYYFSPFFYRNG